MRMKNERISLLEQVADLRLKELCSFTGAFSWLVLLCYRRANTKIKPIFARSY